MPSQELVDRLHRRPPGPRVLYLDTWALSEMARASTDYIPLRDRLEAEVSAGRVLCPESTEHRSEWVLLDDEALREEMSTLSDRLSVGIRLLPLQEVEFNEMDAAAALFSGQPAPGEVWEEAFDTDPHVALDELYTDLFGGKVRIAARMAPVEGEREEVLQRKALAARMNEAYQQERDAGRTFEQLDAANLDTMLKWKLGPLFDPEGARALLERKFQEFRNGRATWSQVAAATRSFQVVEALLARYPDLPKRVGDFYWSPDLQAMPTLRYPSLLRAGLAADPNARKAREGDELDVEHVLFGLSRCDIVTADRSMCHMLRERALVPSGCTLVSAREGADGIHAALDDRLS